MSINYRKVDPNLVGTDVMKQRAVELEQRRRSIECEIDCLVLLLETDPLDADLVTLLATTRASLPKIARAAARAAGAAPLNEDERAHVHNVFYNNWLEGVENSHAKQNALRLDAQRQLDLTGDGALDDEERVEKEAELAHLEKSVAALELRHRYCVSQMTPVEEDEAHDHDHDTDGAPPSPTLEAVPDPAPEPAPVPEAEPDPAADDLDQIGV